MNLQNQLIKLLFVLSVPLTANQSMSQPPRPCTPSIEPAFKVLVSDALTKAPLTATIAIKEAKFQETLFPVGATASGQTIYGGAFERPGNYTVTISKPGYKTLVLKNISITKGDCHVTTRQLNIRLQPLRKK